MIKMIKGEGFIIIGSCSPTLEMRSILLALTFLVSTQACILSSPLIPTCATRTIFLFDATNNTSPADRQKEMTYLLSYIQPALNADYQQVAFLAMGDGGLSTPLHSSYADTCAMATNLNLTVTQSGGKTQSLYQSLQIIYSNYLDYMGSQLNIVIYAKTNSLTDIMNAGSFARQNMRHTVFTVVSLTGTLDNWSYFPANVTLATTPIQMTFGDTSQCALGSSCGRYDYCGSPTTTTTSTTTTTTLPTTTTPPIVNDRLACQCDTEKVWNDVIFLFDNSANTGYAHLQELLGYVQTSFSFFTILSSNYTYPLQHTRIGIVLYNDNATLYSPLGEMTTQDLMNIYSLPSSNSTNTNVNDAILLARQQFNTSAHRPNARKVIVVLASTFVYYNSPNPINTATDFKNDDGIVVVYDYYSTYSSTLNTIASTGYYIDNRYDNGTDMQSAMCNANCRCSSAYSTFTPDPNTKIPLRGCYVASATLANFNIAKNKCQQLNQGSLAMADSANKTSYLQTMLPSYSNFYNGIQWNDAFNSWFWVDGTPLSNSSYQPWFNANHQSGKDCAYVLPSGQWVQTDCRNGYDYVCETTPCDSERYCSTLS